ncbi:MAG: hypothetical protein MMC23_001470 [Stictis urceolatum]|nr:hypothetical protein [Stictis urceolata]
MEESPDKLEVLSENIMLMGEVLAKLPEELVNDDVTPMLGPVYLKEEDRDVVKSSEVMRRRELVPVDIDILPVLVEVVISLELLGVLIEDADSMEDADVDAFMLLSAELCEDGMVFMEDAMTTELPDNIFEIVYTSIALIEKKGSGDDELLVDRRV